MINIFGDNCELDPIMVEQIIITINLPKLTKLEIVKQFSERIENICKKELGLDSLPPQIECIGVKYR